MGLMRKKRRKSRINWAPLLWLAFLAHLGAAIWLSPATSVRKLRIVDAPESERGRLMSLAQTLVGKPAVALDPREFESAVQKESRVESADFRRSLFGSANLKLVYRRAVARLEPGVATYLDTGGVLFQTNDPPVNLPAIAFHPSVLKPSFGIAGPAPLAEIAKLIQRIPHKLLEKGIRAEVDSEGAVCLNITQGATIDLGAVDGYEAKLEALEKLLAERPEIFQQAQALNLTEPSRPAIRPRKGANL